MVLRIKKLKLFFVIFLVFYFLIVVTKGSINNRKVMARYEAAKERYAKAQELNQELKQRLQAVNSSEFIELTARKRLGLVMPGEVVYKIVEE